MVKEWEVALVFIVGNTLPVKIDEDLETVDSFKVEMPLRTKLFCMMKRIRLYCDGIYVMSMYVCMLTFFY